LLQNVIITGADGFIGRNLVSVLSTTFNIIPIIKKKCKDNFFINLKIEPVIWDITKKSKFKFPQGVWIHAASITNLKFCNANYKEALLVNSESVENVMKHAENTGCIKFIYISTLGVYGEPKAIPTDEDHPINPIEKYSMTKAIAERTVLNYKYPSNMTSVIVRPFNIYGNNQNRKMLIPHLIKESISGNTLNVKNINHTRDFLNIDDFISGIMKIIGTTLQNKEILNLGSGIETTVLQIIHIIEKLVDRKLKVNIRNNDLFFPTVTRSRANISKANKLLSWKPQITLKKGIRELIKGDLYCKKI
jgi:nucleoside-diphosphate-sugar epimerase